MRPFLCGTVLTTLLQSFSNIFASASAQIGVIPLWHANGTGIGSIYHHKFCHLTDPKHVTQDPCDGMVHRIDVAGAI